jgi:predicted nucleotidyltransferase
LFTCTDINPTRATEDVDIGACIESWVNHERLRDALVATGRFKRNARQEQRLDYYVPETGERAILDVVPLARWGMAVTKSRGRRIKSVQMSVAGFAEAINTALSVEIGRALVVLVASLPAQAMLKILAWRERGKVSRKDASDLRFLMSSYTSVHRQRLYDHDFDLVEQYDHNPDVAGAALLAQDRGQVVTSAIREKILAALEPKSADPLLLSHMLGTSTRILDLEHTPAIELMYKAFCDPFVNSAVAVEP